MINLTMPSRGALEIAKDRYGRFIESCKAEEGEFRLTPRADVSSYALCFAIFGYKLIGADAVIKANQEIWDANLRNGLMAMRKQRQSVANLSSDKVYMQLLTFTLSALEVVGTLKANPMPDTVVEVLPKNISSALDSAKALEGVARSGNQAMFAAVTLLHARDYLGMDTQGDIDKWVDLHLNAMNRFGFWGKAQSMSHLQFQNGYHQYEIFEYLDIGAVPWVDSANAVASLADSDGHFAPYPGGGGCYDYDAVFIMTADSESVRRHAELLSKTANAIILGQNPDGGFGESQFIRPRSFKNIQRSVAHVLAGKGRAHVERLRYALTLLRPKHDRIQTHWSSYSREWGESDLWDSWFRMLALARIDSSFNRDRLNSWGWIDYPGIGYQLSAKSV